MKFFLSSHLHLCAAQVSFIFLIVMSSCGQPYNLTPTPTAIPSSQPTHTPMPPTATSEPTSTPETSITLQRGINMGNMLEAPNEGEWGLTVQEEYFDLIKEAG